MLRTGLPRFDDERVEPVGLVFHVLATAETINRQPHGLIERPRLHFDGVLNSVRIPERYPAALLHPEQDIIFAFSSPCRSRLSDYFPRLVNNGYLQYEAAPSPVVPCG